MEREGTVTPEQFQEMLASCRPHELWLRTFLTMSVAWGYRVRELLDLQCARVNLGARTVYLPPRSTKNKRPRLIPISDAEFPLLSACVSGKGPQDFVLTRCCGKRIMNFAKRWAVLVARANAGHFEITTDGKQTWYPAIPHDLRRTAISQMLSGGMPPEAVRAVVGHISPAMTQRYYKPALEMLRSLRSASASNFAAMQTPQLPLSTNGAGTGPTPIESESEPDQVLSL